MPKFISAVLHLLLGLFLAIGMPATVAASKANTVANLKGTHNPAPLAPTMWTVTKGNSTVTLFGTIHMLPRNTDWFRPHVVRAIDNADMLILETLPPESEAALLPLQNKLARLTTPRQVITRVPDKWRPRLAEAIKDLNPAALDWYQSWYITLAISVNEMRKSGFEAGIGAEAVLAERARMYKIPIKGLETAEQQLIYFAALSEADQQQLLISALERSADDEELPNRLVNKWLTGDIAALATELNEEFSRTPMLQKMLLEDRNQRWAAEIAKLMKKPGKIFVAVGAGHFAGKGNLLEHMATYGLEAKPVMPAPPPAASKGGRRR